MDFLKWLRRNRPQEYDNKPRPEKDFSNIGVDSSTINYDTAASTVGMFPTVIGSNNIPGFGGSYGGYFSYQGGQNTFPMFGMHSLCRLYQWMAQDPDVRYGIDEIINGATTTDENENIVSLNLDDLEIPKKMKARIIDEFNNVLNMMDFNNNAHFHFTNFYINGRIFYKLDVNRNKIEKGIKSIKNLTPFDVISYFDEENLSVFRDPKSLSLDFKEGFVLTENAFKDPTYMGIVRPNTAGRISNSYVAVPSDLIVYQHSGLVDWRFNIPISYLQLVLKTLNQLRTIKDALVIYRMTRAPERFAFNVEVGRMQMSKAENYLAQVAARLKQKISYNPETGEFRDKTDSMDIYKDWFFPKIEGHGTDVNVLQSGMMRDQLEEVKEFQKMLFRQLFVPFSRFSEDHYGVNFSTVSEMEMMEVKFYKFIKKIQIQFNKVLFDILKKQLSFKNIMEESSFEEIKNGVKIRWGSDNIYAESRSFSLMKKKVELLNEFDPVVGKYHISEEWIVKKIMGFTDEDIKENDDKIEDELKRITYIEAIKRGEIKFDKDGKMIQSYDQLAAPAPDAETGKEPTDQPPTEEPEEPSEEPEEEPSEEPEEEPEEGADNDLNPYSSNQEPVVLFGDYYDKKPKLSKRKRINWSISDSRR